MRKHDFCVTLPAFSRGGKGLFVAVEQFFQQLTNGLAVGGIYALIALGYTMVYGVLKLINFAHADLFTLGAYLGLTLLTSMALTNHLGPLWGTLLLALMVWSIAIMAHILRQTFETSIWVGVLYAIGYTFLSWTLTGWIGADGG